MVTLYKVKDHWGRIRYYENNEKLFLSRLKSYIVDGLECEIRYGADFKSRAAGFVLVDNEWEPVVVSQDEIMKKLDKRQERDAKREMRRRG